MSNTQMSAQEWVDSTYRKHHADGRKRSYRSYGVGNGNVRGRFSESMIISGITVAAGVEFCIYGTMGGSGTAATIFDSENGDITIFKNGRINRARPHGGGNPAGPLRMSVPFGIG